MEKKIPDEVKREILLKNGFDILENGCCYTDLHRIERAMDASYSLASKALSDANKEITRLKTLIHVMYSKGIDKKYGYDWEDFQTKNNL